MAAFGVITEEEIEAELKSVRQEIIKDQVEAIQGRYEPVVERLNREIEFLRRDLYDAKKRRDVLETELTKEIEGTSITQKRGDGAVAAQKRNARDLAQKELQDIAERIRPLVDSRQAEIEKTNNLINTEILKVNQVADQLQDQNAKDLYDGLLARLDALGRMTNKHVRVRLADWFIIVLAILIETAPIVAKLLSKRGVYDEMVEFENDAAIAQAESKRDLALKTTKQWPETGESYHNLKKKYTADFSEPNPEIESRSSIQNGRTNLGIGAAEADSNSSRLETPPNRRSSEHIGDTTMQDVGTKSMSQRRYEDRKKRRSVIGTETNSQVN